MSDEILNRIAGWCLADPKLKFLEEGPAVQVAGDPPLRLDLAVSQEEVLLSHRMSLAGAGETALAQAMALLNKRGSLMRGTAELAQGGLAVTMEYPIYLDGLTRQNFLLATQELAAGADAISGLSAAPAAVETKASVEPAAIIAPVAAAAPAAMVADTIEMPSPALQPAAFVPTHEVPAGGMSAWPNPDPSLQPIARLEARVQLRVDERRGAWARVTGSNGWTGWVDDRRLVALGGAAPAVAATPAYTAPAYTAPAYTAPAYTTAPMAVTSPQPAVFQPTHQVPKGGMQAWATPDPAAAPIAQLAERVQLRIDETRGAWARVTGSNGWTGWVDARRLAALGAGGGGGAMALGALKIRPLALIGGIALIVATFVNWLQFGSSNGFNVGLPFLWGGAEHGGDAPDLGIFTLIIGVAAVLLALLPRTSVIAIRVLGILAVVIAVVFAVQVIIWAGDEGGGFADAFSDGLSVAPYLALGGGFLMLLTRRD